MLTINANIRRGLGKAVVVAGFLVFFSILSALPASAQNGQTRTNSGTAVLHINVNVVPVTFAPVTSRNARQADTAPVVYSIESRPPHMEVTEQVRTVSMPGNTGVLNKVILKTTTVVPE